MLASNSFGETPLLALCLMTSPKMIPKFWRQEKYFSESAHFTWPQEGFPGVFPILPLLCYSFRP